MQKIKKIIIAIFLMSFYYIAKSQGVDTVAIMDNGIVVTIYPSNEQLGSSCVEADKYARNKQFRMAKEKYAESVAKGENLSYSYWNLGMLEMINQKYRKGLLYIDQSIKNSNDSNYISDVYIKKANFYSFLGKKKKELQSIRKALQYNSRNVDALSMATVELYDHGFFDYSIKYGKSLKRLDSTDVLGVTALGMSALEMDSFNLAVSAFSTVFRQDLMLDSIVQEPRMYRAIAYYNLNQYEEAKNDLNLIDKNRLISDWGRSQYCFYKTLVNIKLGNRQESIESFNEGKPYYKRQDLKTLEGMLNL